MFCKYPYEIDLSRYVGLANLTEEFDFVRFAGFERLMLGTFDVLFHIINSVRINRTIAKKAIQS